MIQDLAMDQDSPKTLPKTCSKELTQGPKTGREGPNTPQPCLKTVSKKARRGLARDSNGACREALESTKHAHTLYS
eukprot:4429785-Pyramimonas_sp.AAC.1